MLSEDYIDEPGGGWSALAATETSEPAGALGFAFHSCCRNSLCRAMRGTSASVGVTGVASAVPGLSAICSLGFDALGDSGGAHSQDMPSVPFDDGGSDETSRY